MPLQAQILQEVMPCRLLNGTTERVFSIYLPQGYDASASVRYPVLYLMHGGGEWHGAWDRYDHLSALADSLTARGDISNMIIVCAEANQGYMMYFNAYKDAEGTPDWQYEDYFFKELIPYIESNYRVRTDRGGRAIAGFSMGGGAAVVYGVHHPEMFSMVYGISGYLRRQPLEFLKNDATGEWRQRVIEQNNPIKRIAEGTEEDVSRWRNVDWHVSVGDHDFTLEANMDMVKEFRDKHIPYSFTVHAGDHNHAWVSSMLPDVLKCADRQFTSGNK